jgi:type IV secretory pathway VirB3-like protein
MSSALLLDESVIVVQPALVRLLGHLSDACVLQQLHYWMDRTTNERDGRRWVYKTYRQWSDEVGISEAQARASIQRLEEVGVVVSCQPEAYNRRKWYRIDYDHLLLSTDPSAGTLASMRADQQMEARDLTDRSDNARACTTKNTKNTAKTTTSTSALVKADSNPEVGFLANLLADLIESNGSRRPTVTPTWHTTIDRMIRLDGRTPQQIEAAIRWCQNDDFWRANVMSPDKLRKQYDRLRLQASRTQTTRGLTGVRDYLDTLDD